VTRSFFVAGGLSCPEADAKPPLLPRAVRLRPRFVTCAGGINLKKRGKLSMMHLELIARFWLTSPASGRGRIAKQSRVRGTLRESFRCR